MEKSIPVADVDMSMPWDAEMSVPLDAAMSFPFGADIGDMSFPLEAAMSMEYTCDTVHECPASCDCNGNVADASEEICGCYSITSVPPPFDTDAAPPSGTWYCFQVDLDKTVEGCSDAKEVSHSVLSTGFSESCLFHPGGIDASGSDNWVYQTCDNTAATGLKFDFGHNGITSGNTYSVTYCFDVSCEAAPAGQGSVDWVFKAGNDRCEIQVTEGSIPNCGVSNDLCSPSCPADGGDGNGGGGGGNNGGGKNKAIDVDAGSDKNINDSSKNPARIYGPIVGVFGVAAIAGIVYVMAKKKVPSVVGGDEISRSSADTSL